MEWDWHVLTSTHWKGRHQRTVSPGERTLTGYSRGHRMAPAPMGLINKDWRRTWPSRLSKVCHRRKGGLMKRDRFQVEESVCAKGLGAWGRLEYLWKCGGSALTRLCHHGMWQREANIESKDGSESKSPCEPRWDFLVCCQINGKPLKHLTNTN